LEEEPERGTLKLLGESLGVSLTIFVDDYNGFDLALKSAYKTATSIKG
jgi:hypothetical protein